MPRNPDIAWTKGVAVLANRSMAILISSGDLPAFWRALSCDNLHIRKVVRIQHGRKDIGNEKQKNAGNERT